jgi:hypothetical protein
MTLATHVAYKFHPDETLQFAVGSCQQCITIQGARGPSGSPSQAQESRSAQYACVWPRVVCVNGVYEGK